MISKKIPNNYFNVSRILGIAAINFWKILVFFMDSLKILGIVIGTPLSLGHSFIAFTNGWGQILNLT
jgi:hypothetical protein